MRKTLVQINDWILALGIAAMIGLILENLWQRRLYRKAVNELVDQEEEIADLKTQLLEKDKLVDLKDVLYNTSLLGSGVPFGSKVGMIDKQSISFNGDKYEFDEVRIQPVKEETTYGDTKSTKEEDQD